MNLVGFGHDDYAFKMIYDTYDYGPLGQTANAGNFYYVGTRLALLESSGAVAAVIALWVPDNPFLRFGKGWKTYPDGPRKIWRIATGGRFGKGGPKVPWPHKHWP
jgi:hypothetical protein